ncbi:hypothetical protein PINS_up001704 [Pythium insidiosum]|nr:hypothetical protein PINS_up001704 [Pythium insidiosum]
MTLVTTAAELAASLIVLARGITACFGALCILTKVVAPIVGWLVEALDRCIVDSEDDSASNQRRSQRLAARRSTANARHVATADAVAENEDVDHPVDVRQQQVRKKRETVSLLRAPSIRSTKRVLRPITNEASNAANNRPAEEVRNVSKRPQPTTQDDSRMKKIVTSSSSSTTAKARVLSLGNIFDDDTENVAPGCDRSVLIRYRYFEYQL